MKQYKAVIFDMDGTLVDNMMIHHKAWQEFFSKRGEEKSIEEIRQTIHGVNVEILENLYPNQYSKKELEALSFEKEDIYRKLMQKDLKLIAGVREFLEQLKAHNIPFGIGTAASPENMNMIVDKLSIRHLFDALVHSGMVKRGKPNPEVFEQVATKLGVELKDCLIFEDTPVGATAAENGKADCVVINTTHVIEEFDEIATTIHFMNDYTDMSFLKLESSIITFKQ